MTTGIEKVTAFVARSVNGYADHTAHPSALGRAPPYFARGLPGEIQTEAASGCYRQRGWCMIDWRWLLIEVAAELRRIQNR